MKLKNSEAAVLFSGGSDSTLTASILSEKYDTVHLLTYQHRGMKFEKKCIHSLKHLRDKFGEDRFVHSFFDINSVMDEIYFKFLAKDFREYGTYALPMCCGSCKLAMHVRTILYCQEKGVANAADGSNVELSELFPEQMIPVLQQYKELYAKFGISYSTPVFHVNRSDYRLYEMGVTKKRDYKNEHVLYSNQHSCLYGNMLYAYTLGVSLPLLRRSSRKKLAEKYIAHKIERLCIPFLNSKIGVHQCPVAV